MNEQFDIPADKQRHGIAYVCARYGTDNKPIHPATMHRWILRGKFPKPDKINGMRSWSGKVLDDYDAQLREEVAA